ncbi:hypothetical protein ACISK3_17785 [Morganella morganii]
MTDIFPCYHRQGSIGVPQEQLVPASGKAGYVSSNDCGSRGLWLKSGGTEGKQ